MCMDRGGSNVSMRKYLKTTALNQARTCLKEYVLVLQKYHPDITQRIRPIGIHRSEPIVRAMRGCIQAVSSRALWNPTFTTM